jgi:hypothetical protein
MSRSRYDELHDRFEPILTGKSGTRYERLAAMVWKALHEQNIVVHDVRLMGDSEVSHQIDVKMDRDGAPCRTLIECKDFDVAGAKVGLGILRDFRSVMEDTDADEGVVVTCNGFTRDARKYAKAKSIKLMVLRLFEDADMDGRIQTIALSVRMRGVTDLIVEAVDMAAADAASFQAQLVTVGCASSITPSSPVMFVRGNEVIQFNRFLVEQANELAKQEQRAPGNWPGQIVPDGWSIQVGHNVPLPFAAIDIRYDYIDEERASKIVSDRIAEMLLLGFGTDDIIIFGDQLERRQIAGDGKVL